MFRSLLSIRMSRPLKFLARTKLRIPLRKRQKSVSLLLRKLWRGHGRQLSSEGLEESQQVTLLWSC